MNKLKLKNVFKKWTISQYFGLTQYAKDNPGVYRYGKHTGIDFGMPIGTAIRAPHNGIIVRVANEGNKNRGLHISLFDPIQQIATRYYHLDAVKVELNQEVKAGDYIGTVGNSGFSTGPHLHFECVYTNKDGYVIKRNNGAGGAFDPYGDNVEWRE